MSTQEPIPPVDAELQNTDLFQRIKQRYSGLSKSYQKVALFILDNYHEVAFLTASKLGQKADVSESVVVRFAAHLGYDGYPNLQRTVQNLIRKQLSPSERFTRSVSVIELSKRKSLLEKVYEHDAQNLNATFEALGDQDLERAAEILKDSRSIFVIGLRDAAPLALILGYYLNQISKDVCTLIHAGGEIFEALADAGPRDSIVAFSFSRYTRDTVEAFRLMKERGAGTITITDSPVSPTGQLADVTFRAKVDMPSFFCSYMAALFIVNALVAKLAAVNKKKAQERLDEMEAILSPQELWLKA